MFSIYFIIITNFVLNIAKDKGVTGLRWKTPLPGTTAAKKPGMKRANYLKSTKQVLSDRNNSTVSNFCLLMLSYYGLDQKVGQNPYHSIVSAKI